MIGSAGHTAVTVAAVVWASVVAGGRLAALGVGPGAVALLAVALLAVTLLAVTLLAETLVVRRHRRPFLLTVLAPALAGLLSGTTAAASVAAVHDAPLPAGRVEMVTRAVTDPVAGRFGWQQVLVPRRLVQGAGSVSWVGPPLVRATDDRPDIPRSSEVRLSGRLVHQPGALRGVAVAGRVVSEVVTEVSPPGGVVGSTVELLRNRIADAVAGRGKGGALLAGFLIGDTSGLGTADLELLRRAGLTHFVAVSGSNVALFLGLWWLLLAPLSRFPRVRAATGIGAVLLFALVTRAEPSVVRASAMLAVLLLGRLAGWAFDRWTALGVGVSACLLVSGGLATDVGFQLSVAATVGVMAGGGMVGFGPRGFRTVLGASLAAQLAVAPIVLAVFGTMPLLSPLANLAAAPLVTLATVAGGIGALVGAGPLVGLGSLAADWVIAVAGLVAPWPQIGAGETLALVAPAVVAGRLRWLRVPMAAVVTLAAALVLFPPAGRVERPAVVFLDVGQGDAALVLADGFTAIIDGGPDPALLAERLRGYRVERIDLLVASHVHADHVDGFRSVVGRMPVGSAWMAFDGQQTASSAWLEGAVERAGIPTSTPEVGWRLRAGGVEIEVLGPPRRYASPNDQSIVLMLTVAGRRILFPGDIEVLAQRELGAVPSDVLKVPHQGAATSDPSWLAASTPALAVVSVGANDFGHPAPWVIDTLEEGGAVVLRTDVRGDVVLEPGGVVAGVARR